MAARFFSSSPAESKRRMNRHKVSAFEKHRLPSRQSPYNTGIMRNIHTAPLIKAGQEVMMQWYLESAQSCSNSRANHGMLQVCAAIPRRKK
jgi:hypothetical protein